LISGVSSAESARAEQKPGGPAPNSTALMMRATFGSKDPVWIVREPTRDFRSSGRRASWRAVFATWGFPGILCRRWQGKGEPTASTLVFSLSRDRQNLEHPAAYEISPQSAPPKASRVHFTAAALQAVLYSVFDFLERQGAFFGLDGEVYPLEPSRALNLPPAGDAWHAQPRYSTRGLVSWPDFLNCVTELGYRETE